MKKLLLLVLGLILSTSGLYTTQTQKGPSAAHASSYNPWSTSTLSAEEKKSIASDIADALHGVIRKEMAALIAELKNAGLIKSRELVIQEILSSLRKQLPTLEMTGLVTQIEYQENEREHKLLFNHLVDIVGEEEAIRLYEGINGRLEYIGRSRGK